MDLNMSSRKLRFISIFAVALFATIFAFVAFSFSDTAFAWLPPSYDEAVENGEDWYLGEDYLGIDALKGTVNAWKTDYSAAFAKLEKDPVVIAVIDTGVNYNHDIFRATSDASDAQDVFYRDADGNIIGVNTVDGANDDKFFDGATEDRHGTHVAGIVAILIRELDLEKYVKIMPVKAGEYEKRFSGSGNYFYPDAVASAIDFAVANGADVVNMSLAADVSDMTSASRAKWENLIGEEEDEKAVFVAAAGNNSSSSSDVLCYPAASQYVIGVENFASDGNGGEKLSSTSNYGSAYDIAASGSQIISADGAGTDGYKYLSGTSMASPVVAFAAALLKVKYTVAPDPDFAPTANNLKAALLCHYDETLATPDGDVAVLDLPSLLKLDFRADGKYGVFVDPDCIAISSDTLFVTTGENVDIDLKAEFPTCVAPDFLVYVWQYEYKGVTYTSYGAELSKSLDFTEAQTAEFTLNVSLPGAAEPLAVKKAVVTVTYADLDEVPVTAEGGESAGNGNFYLKIGETMTLTSKALDYVSPDSVVEWYVNGSKAAEGKTFVFRTTTVGSYTVKAEVNGKTVVDEFTVTVRVLDTAGYLTLEIAGYVIGALFVTFFVVCLALSLRRRAARKRAQSDVDDRAE